MVTGLSEETIKIRRYWMSRNFTPSIQADILTRIHPVVNEMISHPDPACFIEMELSPEGDEKHVWLFIESVMAPLKLVIAGAGHIGRALSHIGRMLGFEVTVIDDRP
jgi:xanthine dehydrogenase accessory factor